MTFTPKTWSDDSTGNTPITAAELNRIENGIAASDVESVSGSGSYVGQLAYDQGSGTTYRWTGTKWRPWFSEWTQYGTFTTYNPGSGGTAKALYRWDCGDVLIRLKINFGPGATAVASAYTHALPTIPANMTYDVVDYQVGGMTGAYQRVGVMTIPMQVSCAGGSVIVWTPVPQTVNGVSVLRDGGSFQAYPNPGSGDTFFAEIRLETK